MNRKKIRASFMAILLSTAVLSGCGKNAVTETNKSSQEGTNEISTTSGESKTNFIVTKDMISYDKDDYYTDWKSENPNYVQLDGNSATLNGAGVTIEDSKITINTAGVYVFSGKLDNGQVIIDLKDEGTVKLVLNGAEINSLNNSPIFVKKANKAIITLPEGTENVIKDGENYVLEDSSDEPNAAIFSKANLIINGTGSLIVNGNYNNGVTSKDDLKITGGKINIYAKDDGILGKDMVIVKEGNIKIEAGGDGLKSTNNTEASKGFIAIQGGIFDIKAGSDGIQAETSMLIEDGKYTITTGGGSASAPEKIKAEGPNSRTKQESNTSTKTAQTEGQSSKGVKATSNISIGGGSFNIDSADDSLHSNNSINILAGDFTLTSGDDGIHADSSIEIKDGKINITKSYEGIESTLITFEGGETHVIASDDGINIGGGADGSSVNGRPGQNNLSSSGNNKLNITGGYISVDSNGDGLDANGSIYMSGGTVVVSGPTANNNGALDYDGEFVVTGGVLMSVGSSGMVQGPSESSNQNSVAMSFSTIQKAGTLFAVKDSKGNIIATLAPKKDYSTVVIASPDLKKGEEYTIYSGGTSTGTLLDGLYKDGEYKNGTQVVSFTITNSITWLNESGVTTGKSGNPGGKGNPGAGGPPKTRP